jgi:hypothetical protein
MRSSTLDCSRSSRNGVVDRSTSGRRSRMMDSSHVTRLRSLLISPRPGPLLRSAGPLRNRTLSPSIHSAAAFLQLLHAGNCPSHCATMISWIYFNAQLHLHVFCGAGTSHMQDANVGFGDFRCWPFSVYA